MYSIPRVERMTAYVLVCTILVMTGCSRRRTPQEVETLLNETNKTNPHQTITYSKCRYGEGEWDYICQEHSEPSPESRATWGDFPQMMDSTVGIKLEEVLWGGRPGVTEHYLSQRLTPFRK
jgi:hypothetical protein